MSPDRGCTLEQRRPLDKATAPPPPGRFPPGRGTAELHPQPRRSTGPHLPGFGHWPGVQSAGQKVRRGVPDGHQHGRDPQFPRIFVSICAAPAPAGPGSAQGDRLELENLHGVLAEAQARADALEQIVQAGAEAEAKQREIQINRGAALTGRAAADARPVLPPPHSAPCRSPPCTGAGRPCRRRDAETQARRAYLAAHSQAGDDTAQALDALAEAMARKKTALTRPPAPQKHWRRPPAGWRRPGRQPAAQRRSTGHSARRFGAGAAGRPAHQVGTGRKPLEQQYFAARQKPPT